MANTIASGLLLDTLSKTAIDVLGNRLAPLRAFSRNFTTNTYAQTKAIVVPKITSSGSVQKNPTNYETGDATLDGVSVTVDAYSISGHLTSTQLNQGMEITNLATGKLNALSDKISDVWTALVLDANISTTNTTVAQASFAAANAQDVLGQLVKCSKRYLLLDGVAYAKTAPSDKNGFLLGEVGAYGFDGIFPQTRWTDATANTYGIGCGPEFLAIASGIPFIAPEVQAMLMDSRLITIESLGLTIQQNVWGSTGSRAVWFSYDLMFGAAVADGSAAALILSA